MSDTNEKIDEICETLKSEGKYMISINEGLNNMIRSKCPQGIKRRTEEKDTEDKFIKKLIDEYLELIR